jgi:hypothetical protein
MLGAIAGMHLHCAPKPIICGMSARSGNMLQRSLGQLDLLVEEGFCSNRTDLIRTAILNQLALHAQVVQRRSHAARSCSACSIFPDRTLRQYARRTSASISRCSGWQALLLTSHRNLRAQRLEVSRCWGHFTGRLPSRRRSPTVSGNHTTLNPASTLLTGTLP